ncbi:MAG: hypothetical protein FJZ98_05240 [Chloroflexi bacterium]|nr:hypothetical protein [Chloroflexota bacterium]
MKKYLIPTLLILTLGLAACATATEETPTPAPTEMSAPAEPVPLADVKPNEENPCTTFNIIDGILANEVQGLPPVTEDDWSKGSNDAPITVMVYSDLLCGHCATSERMLNQLLNQYPNDIRIVFRHWVIFSDETRTSNDLYAAQATEAAGRQGKFFELVDILFENQSDWGNLDQKSFDEWLGDKAESLGLNLTQFKDDIVDPEIVRKIEDAKTSGRNLGFGGTPTILLNGSVFKQPRDTLGLTIELIKFTESHFDNCPILSIDVSKTYTATLETTKGNIQVELFDNTAPYAVNSFVFLANQGWYKNLPIISTEQFILSGDPSGTGYGGPGYAFIDEASAQFNFSEPGMLATFSIGTNLNGGSFFINKTALEGQEDRTIFGRVTDGLDILNNLVLRENITAPSEDRIINITITQS